MWALNRTCGSEVYGWEEWAGRRSWAVALPSGVCLHEIGKVTAMPSEEVIRKMPSEADSQLLRRVACYIMLGRMQRSSDSVYVTLCLCILSTWTVTAV